jgi:hypothetical protein
MAFQGTLVGGSGTTTIECAWSGSEAGIKDVATGLSENFIDPSLLDGNDHGTNVPATLTSQPVDLAMGDNAQAYSRTKTPVITANTEVGVITFKWVRNNGLWTGSNVTASQIRQALNGFCPRAVFDGNSADVNDYVYVSGRDNQSGTRVNTFGDSLYGIFSSPSQIEMNSSGVMQLVGGNYAGDLATPAEVLWRPPWAPTRQLQPTNGMARRVTLSSPTLVLVMRRPRLPTEPRS